MLNRLTSPYSDNSSAERSWPNLHRDPQWRLLLMWLAMVAPILVIGYRVAKLQVYLKDKFANVYSETTEVYEENPARDGRIFAADRSTILADDILRYDVAVYYPALMSPPDDLWVKKKAKQRLSKSDAKKKDRLEEEKQKVIEEGEHLWTRLAALTSRPVNELMEARQREQRRVERIKESVVRRYYERRAESEKKEEAALAHPATFWEGLSMRVERAFLDSPHLKRPPREIKEELEYCTVITDITEDMKLEIESNPEKYPLTRVLVHTRRTYPQGELAAHLIGARKPLTDEQLEKRKEKYREGDPQDYHVGDPYGLFGLERRYDMVLKGVRDRRVLIKNRRQEIIETRIVREARPGRDLVLTLNSDLQRRAEQMLDKALKHVTIQGETDTEAEPGVHKQATCPQGGCALVMDIHTGALLTAAAAPRFDLNLYITPDQELWDDVISDKRSPLFSRATEMALPPGSVFKVISAVASIESGKMPPQEPFYCRGYLDRPDQPHRCMQFLHFHVGHDQVTLTDALCRSCNVYFYTSARRMGPQYLVDWARKFGIGQQTGIDLPAESAGHLPSPDEGQVEGNKKRRWKPGDTLDMAIGQGPLVTPLQMVRAVAAIANHGYLVTPHLAANAGPMSSNDADSTQSIVTHSEGRQITGLHESTLDFVREGMSMVVQHPRGTAYKYTRLKQVMIAGKTGTAQTNGVDHAWFVGYVPAERPRYAFVVVLEHGGGGGKAAGPVAKELVQAMLEQGLIGKTAEVASDR